MPAPRSRKQDYFVFCITLMESYSQSLYLCGMIEFSELHLPHWPSHPVSHSKLGSGKTKGLAEG